MRFFEYYPTCNQRTGDRLKVLAHKALNTSMRSKYPSHLKVFTARRCPNCGSSTKLGAL